MKEALPPPPGPSARSANMRGNRRRDTGPELRVRSELHRRGLRFRVDHPVRVPGARLIRPDIVFPRAKLAVFIDGCFWHGCPEHGQRTGGKNRHYWGPKIAGNVDRGSRQASSLQATGWTVLRFWEHEDAAAAADAIEACWREASG